MLTWAIRKLSENLFDYFDDLPSSFRISGFLDNAELSNVRLNTKAVSLALAEAGIPYRVKSGTIDKVQVNLVFTRGETHITVRNLNVLLEPATSGHCFDELVPTRLVEIHSAMQAHFAKIRRYLEGAEESPPEQREGKRVALKEIVGWILKYDPSFSVSFYNVTVRLEDNERAFMAPTVALAKLELRPASHFQTVQWPTEESPTLGFSDGQPRDDSRFVSRVTVSGLTTTLDTRAIGRRRCRFQIQRTGSP